MVKDFTEFIRITDADSRAAMEACSTDSGGSYFGPSAFGKVFVSGYLVPLAYNQQPLRGHCFGKVFVSGYLVPLAYNQK